MKGSVRRASLELQLVRSVDTINPSIKSRTKQVLMSFETSIVMRRAFMNLLAKCAYAHVAYLIRRAG